MNATPASSTPPTGEPRPRESVRPASAGRIALVGAGPGDERLLTLRAAQLLGQADLVISRREPGPRVRELIAPGADVVVLTGTSASTDTDMALTPRPRRAPSPPRAPGPVRWPSRT